jgi:hypothetical protein
MKKLSLILLLIVLALTAAIVMLPWERWLEHKLKSELASRGVQAEFAIEGLGFGGIKLKDITFADSPLTLDHLTVDYSVLELLKGQLRDVKAEEIGFRHNDIIVTAKDAALQFSAPTAGSWSVASLEVENAPLPLPPLKGAGNFRFQAPTLHADGEFISEDKTHHATFTLDHDKSPASRLVINSAALPWHGGTIATRDAVIPLAGDKPVTAVLQVKKVPLDDLMKLMTRNRASATGVVSGKVPVSIGKDGTLAFDTGNLHAEEAGTITLAPDAIPGDNQQVAVLRNVLANFHYRELSMKLNSGKDEKLSMLLQLSGNNPDVYNGREIRLNVHLTGDLLSLLQQSVLPMTDPKQLLKQDHHAEQ